MLGSWTFYKYEGNPTGSRQGSQFSITAGVNDKATYYSWWEDAVKPGQSFRYTGSESGKKPRTLLVFFNDSQFKESAAAVNGGVVTVPAGVNKMRLDLRNWGGGGTAVWNDPQVEMVGDVEPPPPPPVPKITLAAIENEAGSPDFVLHYAAEHIEDGIESAAVYYYLQEQIADDRWETFAVTDEVAPWNVRAIEIGSHCFRVVAYDEFDPDAPVVVATSNVECTNVTSLPLPHPHVLPEGLPVTGFKYGRNFALMLHAPDGVPVPLFHEEALPVRGGLYGRELRLTVDEWPPVENPPEPETE